MTYSYTLPTSPETDELETQLRQSGFSLGRAVKDLTVRLITPGLRLVIDEGHLFLEFDAYPPQEEWVSLMEVPPTLTHRVPVGSLRLATADQLHATDGSPCWCGPTVEALG